MGYPNKGMSRSDSLLCQSSNALDREEVSMISGAVSNYSKGCASQIHRKSTSRTLSSPGRNLHTSSLTEYGPLFFPYYPSRERANIKI